MKKLMALFITTLLLTNVLIVTSCSEQKNIYIYNDLPIAREYEMTEVSLSSLGIKKETEFIILDEKGKEVPHQILYSSKKVIFPVSIAANDSVIYTIKKGIPTEISTKTYGRQVRERKDDFAWENDRIAFRMYGPALAKENPSNGVDVWLKRTENLIVNKFYKNELENGKSYHIDHGEGLDCYKVGNTLGAGGIAPYVDSVLWVGNHYNRFKIIEEGPLRVSFTLEYDTLTVRRQNLRQSITISLDAGKQLNKAIVKYDGQISDMQLAAGIFLHDKIGVTKSSIEKGYIAYAEDAVSDAKVPSGRNYVGVFLPKGISAIKTQDKHLLAIAPHNMEREFVYYFGAGWSKWGFPTDKDWFAYMEKQALILQNPLRVVVK
jgi:hypothetical protein